MINEMLSVCVLKVYVTHYHRFFFALIRKMNQSYFIHPVCLALLATNKTFYNIEVSFSEEGEAFPPPPLSAVVFLQAGISCVGEVWEEGKFSWRWALDGACLVGEHWGNMYSDLYNWMLIGNGCQEERKGDWIEPFKNDRMTRPTVKPQHVALYWLN